MTFVAQIPIKGTDDDGDGQSIGVSGAGQDELKTADVNSHLLKEILAEIRILNRYMLNIVGASNEVSESDTELG